MCKQAKRQKRQTYWNKSREKNIVEKLNKSFRDSPLKKSSNTHIHKQQQQQQRREKLIKNARFSLSLVRLLLFSAIFFLVLFWK